MTGQIINNGTDAFTPIAERLGNIASEMLTYLLYIGIAILGIKIIIYGVKMLISYIEMKSKNTFTNRLNEYEGPIYVGKPEKTKHELIQEYNYEYRKTLEKIGYDEMAGLDRIGEIKEYDNGDIEYTKNALGEKAYISKNERDEHKQQRLKNKIETIKRYRD